MEPTSILIVSDDAAFAQRVKACWQNEIYVPTFTLLGSDLCRDLDVDAFAIAVIGGVQHANLASIVIALSSAEKPVLLVNEPEADLERVQDGHPQVLTLVQREGWQGALFAIAREILKRQSAMARLRQAEEATAMLSRHAALGSYMLEMRHTMNNALTSILGNAELMLLEPRALPAGSRAQIETVRSMAVRIHEILARFSSIDKEFSALERPSEIESEMAARGAGAVQ
ncbi:MAG TPA: hypothetical protein VH437_06590 [Terriglobales bacterium]